MPQRLDPVKELAETVADLRERDTWLLAITSDCCSWPELAIFEVTSGR
jgi:hypothetical protein